MTRKEILKIVISVLIAALTKLRLRLRTIRDYVAHMIFRLALRFPQKCKIFGSSCNVTRTVTTRSEAWQKGDTSVVIQSKTIETYDASKKL